jgi:hypothetical protein
MPPEETNGRILVGEFADVEKPELSSQLQELRESFREEGA